MTLAMRVTLLGSLLTLGGLLSASAQADILYNWGPDYVAYRPLFGRRTVVAYAPTVAYSPVVASGCSTCAVPTTVAYAPVTAYRPVAMVGGCRSCATTVAYAPTTTYYAATALRPVSAFYGGCNSCAVQTAAYAAPACSSCGVNYGVATTGYAAPGCSSCGLSAAVAAPASSFAPMSAVTSVPSAVTSVPTTMPEGTHVPHAGANVVPQTTPTPQVAPQNVVPQTQVEPQPVAPQPTSSTAPTFPPTYRESANEQSELRLQPVPHTTTVEEQEQLRARPQLINPEDKTASVLVREGVIRQAVYRSADSATTGRVRTQSEIDAEGWMPAKR